MQLQFNEYNFVHPPNIPNALKHSLANRIFKSTSPQNQQRCHCCDRLIGVETKISFSCYNTKQLLFLGPGIPLYFLVLRQSSFLLLTSLGIFGIFSLIVNFMGSGCSVGNRCSDNVMNRFSILNLENVRWMEVGNGLVLGTVVVLFVVLALVRRETGKLANKAEKYIDLPSNYSMMLRRLPEEYTEWDIEQMVEQRRGTLTKEEKELTNNLAIKKIILSYSLREIIETQKKNIKEFKKSTKKNVDFFPQENPKPKKVAPLAIVTFQMQASKQFFISESSTWDKFLICLWSAYLPFSQYRIRNKRISIQVAPEPDDIHWENCNISYEGNIMRRLLGKLLVILLLFAGLAAQVILKVIESKFVHTEYIQVINISFSLGVTIINFILAEVLELITKRQRLETVTEQTISTAATLSILQFVNSGIIVMFSNIIVDVHGYTLDGMAENIITIMIINMFVPHLTVLVLDGFKPIHRFRKWRINKSGNVYIQKEVNEAYEGSEGKIALRCVYVIKTIWLAMFFGVFVPLVIPMALIGIFGYYHMEKYMYLRHYKVPNMISQTLAKQTIDLLDYSPFLLAAGNLLIYLFMLNFQPSAISTTNSALIYTSLALAAIYIFLPTDKINQSIFKFKKSQRYKPTYDQVKNNFNTDYDIANPVYHQQNKKKKNYKNLKVLTGQFGNLFSFLCNKGEQQEKDSKNAIDMMMMEMIALKKPLVGNEGGNLIEGYISQKKSSSYQGQPPTTDRLPENEEEGFVIRVSEPNNYVGELKRMKRKVSEEINHEEDVHPQIEMNNYNILDVPMSPTKPHRMGEDGENKYQNLNIPIDDLSGMFDYMSPISRKGSSY